MLGPSAGTLRCVQDRKGRGGTRPDLVFTMVSGVSLHRGSPLRTLLLVTAQVFSDSSSRERDAVCPDRMRRLQLVRCRSGCAESRWAVGGGPLRIDLENAIATCLVN